MHNMTLAAALAATTMLVGGFALAEEQNGGQAAALPAAHSAVVQEYGKLSKDGARAYQDVKQARLAIFDGQVGEAKKLVDRAAAEFERAKSDSSVFTKAEADMRTKMLAKSADGSSDKASDKAGDKTAKDAGTATASATPAPQSTSGGSDGQGNAAQDVSKPVAWLPVDSVVGLAEDYTAQPGKAQAVAKANDSLAKGDRDGAMAGLKLAGVDLDVVTAVVPLQQALNDVRDAAQLIDGGKYYEGSQKLRAVQTGIIYLAAVATSSPQSATPAAVAPTGGSAKPAGK